MAVRLKCPDCGRVQTSSEADAGQIHVCTACGSRFSMVAPALPPGATGTFNNLHDLRGYSSVSFDPEAAPPTVVSKPDRPLDPPDPIRGRPAPVPEPIQRAEDLHPKRWIIAAGVALIAVLLVVTVSLVLAVHAYLAPKPVHPVARGYTASLSSPPLSAFPNHSASIPPTPTTLPASQFAESSVKPSVDAVAGRAATAPSPGTTPETAPTTVPAAIDNSTGTPAVASAIISNSAAMPAVAPAPVPPTTAPTAAVPARFHPVPMPQNGADMDDQIGQSITRGVNYLLAQFDNKGRLKDYDPNNGVTAGLDALAVYALLQAGEATHDPRLSGDSSIVDQMLKALVAMPMNNDHTVYSRSLRAAALAVYHRPTERNALRADSNWLTLAGENGAFTYVAMSTANANPAPPVFMRMRGFNQQFRFPGHWDNSNSQYGALGVWAAAEAGVEVPTSFWQQVQKHWIGCQRVDGQWGYTDFMDSGRLSMTVAGITTLLVTGDELDFHNLANNIAHDPFTPQIAKGLAWLESGDNSVSLPITWRTYNLFGLERAALASGFKYFGSHNWYRELADQQIHTQLADGSWAGDDSTVDTAYTLLFLSRGRHPIFMNKLRFDRYWSNRPRDLANLTRFAVKTIERQLNWQVVSLQSDFTDWMDSPVLYIASHEPVSLSEADISKLRDYANNGGLIFTHADGDSGPFNTFVSDLAKKLFPGLPLRAVPADDALYTTALKMKTRPPLLGISNGSRWLLIHSPKDLNKAWQQRDWAQHLDQFQIGLNIFIYAAGKENLRNKLKTPWIPPPTGAAALTTKIALIRHAGDFDPEPAALTRFSRAFDNRTSALLIPVIVDAQNLDPLTMPIAVLTGTTRVTLTAAEIKLLHDYVNAGGALLIDSCGGSPLFTQSMLAQLAVIFPGQPLQPLGRNDDIIAGKGPGMTPLNLRVRACRADRLGVLTQPLLGCTQGKGRAIFSDLDIITGLLGTNTYSIEGYEPEVASDILSNLALWALQH